MYNVPRNTLCDRVLIIPGMLEKYSVVVIVCVPLNGYYSASFICSLDDGDFEFFFLLVLYCIAC